MDFERANKMMDEINNIFSVIEDKTEEINEEKHEAEMEIFTDTIMYFNNWAKLFDKARIPNKRTGERVTFRIKKGSFDVWKLEILLNFNPTKHIKYSLNKIGVSDDDAIYLMNDTDRNYIDCSMRRIERMGGLKDIDFDYVEEQLVAALHHAIEKKAAYIESEYQKAIER